MVLHQGGEDGRLYIRGTWHGEDVESVAGLGHAHVDGDLGQCG